MSPPSVPNKVEDELLALTQQLLDSIAGADWTTYETLCDPSLSAFEPEAQGHLVEGLAFHRYYFELGADKKPCNTTIASPHVRVMRDVAVVSYVRLVQSIGDGGTPITAAFEETRVWHMRDGTWRHVHFHRSRCD